MQHYTIKTNLILKIILYIILSILAASVLLFAYLRNCGLSDAKAINIANKFMLKHNIVYAEAPYILHTYYDQILFGTKYFDITAGDRGDFKYHILIECKRNEVVSYTNNMSRSKYFRDHDILSNGLQHLDASLFLIESRAKDIALHYANAFDIPPDAVFDHMEFDNKHGIWSAYWKRAYNGFQFEDDYMAIQILGINGELYSYSRHFIGNKCNTNIKVTKDEAVTLGYRTLSGFLLKMNANKYLYNYVVKSVDLKIVQQSAFSRIMTPFKIGKSRLAWVIGYELVNPEDKRMLEDVNFMDKFLVKIDAENGKLIGGSFAM